LVVYTRLRGATRRKHVRATVWDARHQLRADGFVYRHRAA